MFDDILGIPIDKVIMSKKADKKTATPHSVGGIDPSEEMVPKKVILGGLKGKPIGTSKTLNSSPTPTEPDDSDNLLDDDLWDTDGDECEECDDNSCGGGSCGC